MLILTQSTSYSFFNASLICLLFALTSQMKTRVLFSSIFFIADSVLSGWMMILAASRRGCKGIDLRGYLGERESWRVFGRWKVVERRTLRTFCEWTWKKGIWVRSCRMERVFIEGLAYTSQSRLRCVVGLCAGLASLLGRCRFLHVSTCRPAQCCV